MKTLILATGMLLFSVFSANAALISHSLEEDITETRQRFTFDFTDLSQFEDGKDAYLTFVMKGKYGRLNAQSATLSLEFVHGSARVGTTGEQLNMISGFDLIDYYDTSGLGLTGTESIVATYKVSGEIMDRLKGKGVLRAKVSNASKVTGSSVSPLSTEDREFVKVVMSSEPTSTFTVDESPSLYVFTLGLLALAGWKIRRRK